MDIILLDDSLVFIFVIFSNNFGKYDKVLKVLPSFEFENGNVVKRYWDSRRRHWFLKSSLKGLDTT